MSLPSYINNCPYKKSPYSGALHCHGTGGCSIATILSIATVINSGAGEPTLSNVTDVKLTSTTLTPTNCG